LPKKNNIIIKPDRARIYPAIPPEGIYSFTASSARDTPEQAEYLYITHNGINVANLSKMPLTVAKT
jgi:hypothetical protein